MTFAVFIVYQLFNVMNCRSNEESVFELGLFSNRHQLRIAHIFWFAALLRATCRYVHPSSWH